MKKISTLFGVSIIALSLFNSAFAQTSSVYQISLVSTETVGTNQVWTWSLTNPNPGNGSNGTLQDVSHWSIDLPASAESALLTAEWSTDNITWHSVPITIDRDPSLKCSWMDVLKFDRGTTGTQPTYYRASFSQSFSGTPKAVSFIKTGGGLNKCNMVYFMGVSEQYATGSY